MATNPIYSGPGLQLDGFGKLTEVALAVQSQKQKAMTGQLKALDAQRDKIRDKATLGNEYNPNVLVAGVRPFWLEYISEFDNQIENLTDRNGNPINTIHQGRVMAQEAINFHNSLKGFQYNRNGDAVSSKARESLTQLILNPSTLNNFSKQLPVDMTVHPNMEGLALMDEYAEYGFMGVAKSQMLDASYRDGGYHDYGEIDYTSGLPVLKIFNPTGMEGVSGPTSLDEMPIYGDNSSALYDIHKFATEMAPMSLSDIGKQFVQPLVKGDREGLGWDKIFAETRTTGVLNSPSRNGQSARYAMYKEYFKENPDYLSKEEANAFKYLQPELAFERDAEGNTVATPTQLEELDNRFRKLMQNSNLFDEIVRGSNYDRSIPTDATEAEGLDALSAVANSMTTANPNNVWGWDDLESMVADDKLLFDEGNQDRFVQGYARLMAQNYATLGGGNINSQTTVNDILMADAPGWRLVGLPPENAAGVTRQFVESFGGTGLPNVLGNFAINMSGATSSQFSPKTGVDGPIDNVYFNNDGTISVKLNKTGTTGALTSSEGRNIVPIEGSFSFAAGDPLFSIGVDADGGNEILGGGYVEADSPLLSSPYETGSSDLVFSLSLLNDRAKLIELGTKLDDYFKVRGKNFPNAVSPDLGYTLNLFYSKSNN
tara:strand:- start:6967 stop:8937 length:1971 start_codon:yes stop_codon:yes gene_type:complete